LIGLPDRLVTWNPREPVGAAEVGQVEGVVAVDADVVADERREPRNVGVEYRIVLGA
jgi:hypothetical protein